MLIWNMMALLGCQGKEFCRMAPSKTGPLGLGMTSMAKAGKVPRYWCIVSTRGCFAPQVQSSQLVYFSLSVFIKAVSHMTKGRRDEGARRG